MQIFIKIQKRSKRKSFLKINEKKNNKKGICHFLQ